MSALLPCPFCGSPAEVNEWGGGFVPACSYLDSCCSGRMSGDKEKAIGRWNTRTQPAPDPLLDQMAEALQKSRKHADDWRAEYSSAGIAADPELDSDIAEIDAALSAYDARRKP